MSGGKSSKQTVGYKYYMGLHFGICHGPVDALAEIRVGGRTAYATEVTGSTTIYINAPKLFGGEKREGGIQGYADVLGGTPTQGTNEYIQSLHPESNVPAFRGLFALVYKGGLVSANNPYIKPWAFKVRRIIEGWGEYGTEEVTELTTDVLPDWVEDGSTDPRAAGYTYEYRYDGNIYDTHAEAKSAAESSEGYSLSDFLGWRVGTHGSPPSAMSGISSGVTADEREFLSLSHVGSEYLPYVSSFVSIEEYTGTGGGNPYPFVGIEALGIGVNSMFFADITINLFNYAGLWYFIQNDGAGGDPPPEPPNDNWIAPNNCEPPESCPYPNADTAGIAAYAQPVTDIGVRRVPAPPPLPGFDLPDWPEDPDNYWWNPDTGQTYSKEPWVQTSGSYRWLAKYSVSGGGTSTVERKPLGPVLEVGDPNDTEAFWTAAYEAAVTAGTLPAGMTFDATGAASSLTRYPKNATYAYTRTYHAIVPAEPPDAGLAQIGDDMNPAHIVRQCITNTEWGMGYPDALIGESFTTVAQALYDEEFGLSFQWTQPQPIEDFIGEVLNHCGGVWYADPRTGLFELALIRDDYDASDLRVFDESNIQVVESYQRPGYGELVNQIVVAWTDVQNNKTATTAPLQDSACIAAQGSVIGEVRQYPGITKADLAQRVALRDLTAASTPLASLTIKVNREAWDLIPGKDVIVVSWAKLGITQMVCRVLKVDRGSLDNGVITIECAEDVFGLPDNVYTTQEPEGWTEPDTDAEDITMQDLVESPYWDLARNLSAADLDYTDPDSGYVFTLAGRNNAVEIGYDIWSRTGANDYAEVGSGTFAPTALLNGDIDQQDTTINLDNGVDLDEVTIGSRVLIGSGAFAEFCEVVSLDTTTGVMAVNRAVLDTTPQEHADNTRVWFVDNAFGVDPTERVLSDAVDVKLTSQAPNGGTEVEDATEQSITIEGRFGKPYPPGRVRINGDDFPDSVDTTEAASEGFVIEWAHRDRTQQDVELVSQNAGDIGPEPGTTYTVELYNDATDALLDSASGLVDTTISLSSTESFPARLELYSVNGGRESWQRQIRRFLVIGDEVILDEDDEVLLDENDQPISAG